MPRRLPIALLAVAAAGCTAAPAHANLIDVGPDLSQTGPSTVSRSDPNDLTWWPGDASITVPAQGEIRAIKIKGGTVQSAEQRSAAQAFDPNYDIAHWLVLRPQPDGSLKVVSNSEDVRLPIIGMGGVDEDTITTLRQPQDTYRVCAQPGDVVSLASVGGYVPTNGPTGVPLQKPGFQEGLPYQVFTRSIGAVTNEYRKAADGGGQIHLESSVKPTPLPGVQLNMQAVLGTGSDARYTCQTAAEQGGGGSAGGGAGGGSAKVKPPMATPLNKRRALGKDKRVGVSLTCRADGAPCAGTIELRVHKKRIGFAKYAGLAPGATGTFPVKLTRKGVYFVKADSDRRMLTSVVVTATGGRKGGGKMYILPRKR